MRAAAHSHLYRRGKSDTFYVRRFIPADLIGTYPPGKREIVRSLRTSDEPEAIKRGRRFLAHLDKQFELKRSRMQVAVDRLTASVDAPGALKVSAEIEPALEAMLLRQFLDGDGEQRRMMADAGQFESWKARLTARLSELQAALARQKVDDWRGVFEIVAKDAGIDVSIASVDEDAVAELVLRTATRAVQLQLDACEGRPKPLTAVAPDEQLSALTTTWDAAFGAWENHSTDRPVSTVIHQRTAWHGLRDYAKAQGVLFPGQVSTRLIGAWVEDMQQRLAHKTVTERLSKVKHVFRVAYSRELLAADPAARVLAPTQPNHQKGRDRRKAFSEADLRVIFGCPIYTAHLRSAGQSGEATYWIPLIMLFTGARPEEIAGLEIDDIVKWTGSRWYFRFTDIDEVPVSRVRGEGRQRRSAATAGATALAERRRMLKNAASRRRVPVAAELIALGLLRYMEHVRTGGHRKLFPGLKRDAHGKLSGPHGKFFGRLLGKLGIVDADKTLYSLRHGFKDLAEMHGVDSRCCHRPHDREAA